MIPAGPVPQTAVGVVASFDFTRDRELWRWAPPDVSLYVSRTDAVSLADSFELVSRLNDPAMLTRPTREVARVPISAPVVLYCCTAGSFVGGVEREHALRTAMTDAGAPSAVTTSGGVLEALGVLGARRIAVVHPYVDPIADRLVAFLIEAGIDVLSSRGLGLESRVIGAVDYATTADLISGGDHPDADAIFVSCTLLPTYDLIAPLEQRIGKPIITANQVGIWAALRAIGVKARGAGQELLRH
ncbi:Asp/Glu racemase [Amycolatopsis sp. NPDC059021]|uniref:maleate cis-trans isomerase family protein n=1 Tax=Amycolatopsis sp. NPDC059021 TaxID=3346704 RepID=UPI00366F0775